MGDEPAIQETPRSGDHVAVRTFLIADVRGYTAFTNQYGVAAAARLADRFAEMCRAAATRHAGEVIELRGDEALAVFAAPSSALHAAMELHSALEEETRRNPELPLRVGIGVDSGEVIPIQGGFRGKPLNLAARLCSLAGPGDVFTTEAVAEEANRIEGLAYVERGRVRLKGFEDPIQVIQVLSTDDLPENFPPLASLISAPSNLPVQATSFIGREREAREVQDLVLREDVRLLTLTGTGGAGKTRLALHVAETVRHSFDYGVVFVNLSSLSDPELIPTTILATLRAKEGADTSPLDALKTYLGHKQLLLVLDTFEHLLDGAPVVANLLSACPNLTVLVTSRSPLRITWEHFFAVLPLAVPDLGLHPDMDALVQSDAVALFIDRARAVAPAFVVSLETVAIIAKICAVLDGLPLAIELAAARVYFLPPTVLLSRLSDRMSLLAEGARDAPARHRTLEATIEWSYGLLTPEEKTVFARLAVFRGGCTFEAAEAICIGATSTSSGVFAVAMSLLEKSLVTRKVLADGEVRVLMLDTIQEFAAGKLSDSEEAEQLRAAHARYFFTWASAQKSADIPQEAWFSLLSDERENLRSAIEWARERRDMASVLRVGPTLHVFWISHGLWSQARAWLNDVWDWNNMLPVSERISVLGAAAEVGGGLGDPRTNTLLEERAQLRSQVGDPGAAPDELNLSARRALAEGDMITGRRLLEEELILRRQVGEGEPDVLGALGWIALEQGDYRYAAQLYTESLELSRKQGDTHAVSLWLDHLGHTALCAGEQGEAERYFGHGLRIQRSLDDAVCMARSLRGLGRAALQAGNPGSAARLVDEALALDRSTNHARAIAWSLCLLGDVRAALGQSGVPALYAESLRLTGAPEDRWAVLACLDGLIRLWTEQGHISAATRLFGALEHARRFEPIYLGAPIRDAIGGYFGRAHRLKQEIRVDVEGRLSATSTTGTDSLRQPMTISQAVAYALGQIG